MRGFDRRWVLAGLISVGCSRDNPAYGDTEGAGEASTATEGTSMSGATDVGPMTTGGSFPVDSGSDSGPAMCGFEEPEPYELRGQLLCPEVPDEVCLEVASQPMGGSSFDAFICHDCTCAAIFEDMITPDFDIPLPVLPPFVQVNRVPVDGQAGGVGCDLLAYAVLDLQSGMLLAAASNVLQPAPGVSVGMDIGESGQPCGEGCGLDPPGRYDLVSPVLGIEIAEGSDAEVGAFQVYNEFSRIDDDCEQLVRWHAVRNP